MYRKGDLNAMKRSPRRVLLTVTTLALGVLLIWAASAADSRIAWTRGDTTGGGPRS